MFAALYTIDYVVKDYITLTFDEDGWVVQTYIQGWGRTVRQGFLVTLTTEGLVVYTVGTGHVCELWSAPAQNKSLIEVFTKQVDHNDLKGSQILKCICKGHQESK